MNNMRLAYFLLGLITWLVSCAFSTVVLAKEDGTQTPTLAPMAVSEAESLLASQDQLLALHQSHQVSVDSLDAKNQKLLLEYRELYRQAEQLKLYNARMAKVIQSQEQEKRSVTQQIASVDETKAGLLPLMSKMFIALEQLILADLPFLQQERQNRVAKLEQVLNRSDVSESEKFRKLLEAYQIEQSYGVTLEREVAIRPGSNDNQQVELLNFGRLALLSRTLDHSQYSVWDATQNVWHELDVTWHEKLAAIYQVALGERATLLAVPLKALANTEGK